MPRAVKKITAIEETMTHRSFPSHRLTATALSAVIALSLPLVAAPASAGSYAQLQRKPDQRSEAPPMPQPRPEISEPRGERGGDRGGERGGDRGPRGGDRGTGGGWNRGDNGNAGTVRDGGWNRQPGQDGVFGRPDRTPGTPNSATPGGWQGRPDRNDSRPDGRPGNGPNNGADTRPDNRPDTRPNDRPDNRPGNDGRWNGGRNPTPGGWTGNRDTDHRGGDWGRNDRDWGRNDRNDRNDRDRNGWDRNGRDRGGWDQRGWGQGGWDHDGDRNGWSSRHSYNWRTHRDFRSYTGVRIGFYFAPRYGYYRVPSEYYGYRYDYGDYLPRYFYSYRVYDPDFYFLPPKPYGCEYYFVGNDIVLVDLRTGRIIDVFYDVF